jgi:hypothetical protein
MAEIIILPSDTEQEKDQQQIEALLQTLAELTVAIAQRAVQSSQDTPQHTARG